MKPGPHENNEISERLVSWGCDSTRPTHSADVLRTARAGYQHMRRGRGRPRVATSALINEGISAWLPFGSGNETGAHFLSISARLMRQISNRRGAQAKLSETAGISGMFVLSMMRLETLESIDGPERNSRVAFLGGLSIEEPAEVLKVSTGTVMRDSTSHAHGWVTRALALLPMVRPIDASRFLEW